MARKSIGLMLAWVLSLVVVAAIAHAQTAAQRTGRADPGIISGSDLGFRIERQRGDHVTGTFVVRINGNWWDVEPPTVVKPLSGK